MKKEPIAWYCKKCGKFDFADSKESLAKPEHIPHRGADIGSCDGEMIPLYELTEEEMKILNEYNNGKEIFIKQ